LLACTERRRTSHWGGREGDDDYAAVVVGKEAGGYPGNQINEKLY
jgi:hypothetical protein